MPKRFRVTRVLEEHFVVEMPDDAEYTDSQIHEYMFSNFGIQPEYVVQRRFSVRVAKPLRPRVLRANKVKGAK